MLLKKTSYCNLLHLLLNPLPQAITLFCSRLQVLSRVILFFPLTFSLTFFSPLSPPLYFLLFKIETETSIANFLISSITFEGHQFLDTIRPDSVWEKIRTICEKTGLKSIATIMDVADILLPDTLKKALP